MRRMERQILPFAATVDRNRNRQEHAGQTPVIGRPMPKPPGRPATDQTAAGPRPAPAVTPRAITATPPPAGGTAARLRRPEPDRASVLEEKLTLGTRRCAPASSSTRPLSASDSRSRGAFPARAAPLRRRGSGRATAGSGFRVRLQDRAQAAGSRATRRARGAPRDRTKHHQRAVSRP